jgi:hypothetical protein
MATEPNGLSSLAPIPLDWVAADRRIGLEKRKARGVLNTQVRRKIFDAKGREVEPNLAGIGTRSRSIRDAVSVTTYETKSNRENDILNAYAGHFGILRPEYDLLEPWTLIDTESYFERAIKRRLDLAFRNGIEIVGESNVNVDYIKRRLNQMAFVMRQSWLNFFKEVLRNLYVCSNCILIKIRDEAASGGAANDKNDNLTPIAGYKLVAPHTIFPLMDGKGGIQAWRRFFTGINPWKDYPTTDVIHFKWNVKPGHFFGTPFSVPVVDDIFALRRLEENIELLLVNHLFPLFHAQVGTPEAPCEILADGSSEIDMISDLISALPKDGVLVTDERTKVTVVGAAKEGVDPQPILSHYKQRVFTGLGMSGLDLGEADTGNRSTADNVSQNLKDSIKADTDDFSGQLVMQIFVDLFREAPGALSVQNAVSDVHPEFHEIDVDTQIKKETHAANMFNNHGLSQSEYRKRMKYKPLTKEQEADTHFQKHVVGLAKVNNQLQNKTIDKQFEHQKELATQQQQTAMHTAVATKSTKVTKKAANGASHTTHTVEPSKHAAKAVAAVMQPSNQHGKNLDPHKARSSQDPSLLERVYDALLVVREDLVLSGALESEWDDALHLFSLELLPDDSLTEQRDSFLSLLELSSDSDQIWTNLRVWALNS